MSGQTKAELISKLLSLIDDQDKEICKNIVSYLHELGYMPVKQKVQRYVLSFKNNKVKQTIAKISTSGNEDKRTFFSIKFYACKRPPHKFLDAVQKAIESTDGQYRCCGCGVCGAEKKDQGYRCIYPDGEEFISCGAYAVKIPNLVPDDIDDFKSLLLEQHEYFLSRVK